MSDKFTKEQRSKIMASITGKDTKPEIMVRSFLFRHGFRFKKNDKSLIGTPDVVLPKYHAIVFVHGCFWHGHACGSASIPKTNTEFWKTKIERNQARDKKAKRELLKQSWRVIYVWECELKNKQLFEDTMAKVIKKIVK